jgi:hypothetical protein
VHKKRRGALQCRTRSAVRKCGGLTSSAFGRVVASHSTGCAGIPVAYIGCCLYWKGYHYVGGKKPCSFFFIGYVEGS